MRKNSSLDKNDKLLYKNNDDNGIFESGIVKVRHLSTDIMNDKKDFFYKQGLYFLWNGMRFLIIGLGMFFIAYVEIESNADAVCNDVPQYIIGYFPFNGTFTQYFEIYGYLALSISGIHTQILIYC